VVSVLGLTLMAILFVAELLAFAAPQLSHAMAVDATRSEKLPIHLNLTFPALPCAMLSLDALDMSGKHEVRVPSFATAGLRGSSAGRLNEGVPHPHSAAAPRQLNPYAALLRWISTRHCTRPSWIERGVPSAASGCPTSRTARTR
jgi:hypothetical protein